MEITISLRPELMPQIEAAAQHRGQALADFLAKLVEEAITEPADEELERQLLEGLDSGEPIEVTPEYWQQLRTELTNKYGSSAEAQ